MILVVGVGDAPGYAYLGKLVLDIFWNGTAFSKVAPNSPHSRLSYRRTHTTPGCRPGLYEGAASQLYKDGL